MNHTNRETPSTIAALAQSEHTSVNAVVLLAGRMGIAGAHPYLKLTRSQAIELARELRRHRERNDQ